MISFIKQSDTPSPEKVPVEKVIGGLKLLMQKRFPGDYERQKIVSRLNGQRLNLCCPYCGDSSDNARKKRGNFYPTWSYFKCYNGGCAKYVDFLSMMKDFGVDTGLSEEELSSLKITIATSRDAAKEARMLRRELSLNALTNADFEKVLVPRDELMKTMRLIEVHPRSQMGVYLEKRLQPLGKRFAWDSFRKKLYIFNLDSSESFVFALQTRQFGDTDSKYLTYNLSGIWTKMMKCTDEEFLEKARELDSMSTVFSVLHINFNDVITLFEGPLDSFLYRNSCGMCSVNNSWPFDIDNVRWFQDNDEAGRKKAMEVLAEGKSVFLWKKFIDDFELHGKKIKDYNDIVIYQRANNVDFGDLEKYWSTHKYDGVFL